jgi:predicted ATPase
VIDSLRMTGLKSFVNETIYLKGLTVLTGLNNSGKSTVIQALRMGLAHSAGDSPYLEGLGGYAALKSKLSPPNSPIELELTEAGKGTTLIHIAATGCEYRANEVSKLFQYISADRFGPRVRLPVIGEDMLRYTVGSRGQFSAHYASIFENAVVSEKLRHRGSTSHILRHQLISWMREVAPGVVLDFDVAKDYDASNMLVDGRRSINSGFGISYTLPIVLAILTMSGAIKEGESDKRLVQWFGNMNDNSGLLLIENPEAHLHPQGQTSMGRLLALAAAAGLQIVVETHSDHVLDGIRLAVRHEDAVSEGNVAIKFLERNDAGETVVKDIQVKKDGRLDIWPKGFFDQFSINLKSLSSKY